jgi:hypothetical protein
MTTIVYSLCALTSLICAVLLLRGYRRGGARLLLWSGLCFVCMFINNAMVLVDYKVVPATDLSVVRLVPAVFGIALLVYGLVWESDA